ncbi:MAG: GNAT family N-acetyltransferase, partial [Acidobacteriota bacterium]
PIVAVISRITPKKGIDHFLEAAARISTSRRDVRFLVVGDGALVRDGQAIASGQRGVLEARAAELGLAGRVQLTGFRLDVPEILAQVDIAVVPSLSEALSNSLLEAMAAAAPVIATRVGDHDRVVQDGVSGLLVPPGDVDALAKRTLHLLGDPAKATRLGEAARRTVQASFSLERMARDTEALYDELLARERPVRARSPRVEIETVSDAAGLHGLGGEWDALHARAGHEHPFVSHAWASTWWHAFGAGHELNVLVARRGGECIGIAPLMRTATQMFGLPVTQLELIGNVHTPRNDLLCSEPAAYGALVAHLARTRAAWDVLVLPQLVEGSPTIDAISRLGAEHHVRTGLWMARPSPVLHVTGELAVSTKMRQNLRNRSRRLAALGEVAIETITGGPGVAAALPDALRLEAAAWKSANGTAITSDPAAERFYTRLADAMAARGWLDLRFLTLEGRRISFAYSLRYGDTLFVLKQGYDPALGHCSPGMVMFDRIIAAIRQQGLAAIDFLGDDEAWKLSWGAEPRRHAWLFGFPPTPRARLLHALKFNVVPAIREHRARAAAHP